MLSRHSHAPDLLGFGLSDFYAFAMIRRGDIGWDKLCGRDVSSMTPDGRDVLFVDILRRRIVGAGGV